MSAIANSNPYSDPNFGLRYCGALRTCRLSCLVSAVFRIIVELFSVSSMDLTTYKPITFVVQIFIAAIGSPNGLAVLLKLTQH